MMMLDLSVQVQLMTAEELLALPRGQFRYELIKGELKKMSPTGHVHGRVTVRLTWPLAQYVRERQLGEVYAAETGFKLRSNPDTVLAPDIAFIRRARVIEVGDRRGYWPGAPDLAIEVLSPNDKAAGTKERVLEWLGAGSMQVWIVNPRLRTVTIYRSPSEIETLSEKDTLDGGDLVPGFQIRVAEIFEV